MSVQKVKGSTYVETEFEGANVGCVNTEHGLILVDTPHVPSEVHQWKASLARINKDGIAYVINTHHHYDHCLGNTYYGPDIIANQLCYEEMSKPDGTMRNYFISAKEQFTDELKKQIYEMPITLPSFTFSQHMWLHLGDTNIELIHVGGHTQSSIIVLVVEDKVLFAGDNVVANTHPYIGQADIRQWRKVLETIKDMDIDIIVPGHGEICNKGEVQRMLEYFQLLWDRVSRLHREGFNRDSVIKQAHELISYYPIEPAEEARRSMLFDEGVGSLYDQIGTPL